MSLLALGSSVAVPLLTRSHQEPNVVTRGGRRSTCRAQRPRRAREARLRIAGGAVYDAVVGLAALRRGALLATRDARARATYEAIGTAYEIVG